MTEFQIKVFKQSRVLLSLLILGVILPFCVLLSAKLELLFFKLTIPIFILATIITMLFYYSFGHLKITIIDRTINFNWKQKPIFNFKEYNSIRIEEITTIIVEQEIYLKKLITINTEIELRGTNSKNSESLELLSLLKRETNIKPIDSWDVWKKRGWLKLAYRLNLLILIIAIGTIITTIIIKGFDIKLLLFIPLVLSQLILSHRQMKNKLK
jgi:hypothetical protein